MSHHHHSHTMAARLFALPAWQRLLLVTPLIISIWLLAWWAL